MSTTATTLGQLLAEESAKLDTVTMNRARRYRTPKGDLFPSVTSVLGVLDKPALVHWSGTVERELCVSEFVGLASDMRGNLAIQPDALRRIIVDRIGSKLACYRKRDEAGDTGTKAHALIEHRLKKQLGFTALDEPDTSDEAALWAYLQFEEFARSCDLEPVAMEVAVWSREGFAGRMDVLARVNGRLSILDWKSGKAIYDEAKFQNAAYRLALNERLAALGRRERVELGHIVLLPKVIESDAKFQVATLEDDTAARACFLAALSLWKALEGMKGRKS